MSKIAQSFFLSFILFVNFLSAQQEADIKPSVFKEMEIHVGMGTNWANVNPVVQYNPQRFNVFPRYNQWGIQFMVNIELNDRISISTGFKRTSNFIEMDTTEFVPRSLNDRWSYRVYDFKDWEIPLRFRYIFSQKSIRPFLDASISLNGLSQFSIYGFRFNRSNPSSTRDELFLTGSPENNGSYDLGGGVYIDIGKKLSLMLDARIQLSEFFWISKEPIQLKRQIIGMSLYWNLLERKLGN